MGEDNNRKLRVPERRTSLRGTHPHHRAAASNLARTKLENVYAKAELNELKAQHSKKENAKKLHANTREKIIHTIDRTRGDQIPNFSKVHNEPVSDEIKVRKSQLEHYHTTWQKYYKKYYED